MTKVVSMVLCGTVAASVLCAQAVTENSGPKQATYVSAEEVQAVLKSLPPAADKQIKVVDTGKYNVGVGILHRGKISPRADGSVPGIAHHNITEAYVIISGSGILVTGGTIEGGTEVPADGEIVRVVAGPSVSGAVKTGFAKRPVKTGDVVVIPPDVFHGWAEVEDHIDYVSVRPDPNRVLPAGYVNPAIKK